ncbi:MAG: exosortase H-associated membrane protein [Rudaea sp.]
MTISPLRRFILAAMLWLPFAFFLWFEFAAQFSWPVIQIAKTVLLKAWPAIYTAISQGADVLDMSGRVLAHHDYLMQFSSAMLINVAPPGAPAKFGFPEYVINPMIYGYSVPLFAGLVMATPNEKWRRALQMAAGLLLLWLMQSFGVVCEALEIIGIKGGAEGAAAMHQAGISLDVIALCYQFGYLILPPLVPAVLWILFNRPFIEELTRSADTAFPATASPAPEPNRDNGVETQQPGD